MSNAIRRKIACQTILKKRNNNEKMYHIKNDQRAVRSAEMLYYGLAKLVQETPFDTIKVKDLVAVAHVGRTTFYRNFDTIEDVLRLRCDQVAEALLSYLHEYHQKHPDESSMTLLKPVLRYFYLHSEFIEVLIKAKHIHIFEESLINLFSSFKPLFRAFFGVEEDYVEYIMHIRIASLVKILTLWIETGKQQTPDDLADKLGTIMSEMVALEKFV